MVSERKVFSQHGEDGILEWLGLHTPHKYVVEIGSGDGTECNSRHLIENYSWCGTLIDPHFGDWVTAENVNDFVCGDIGVLSIDVDGNDYWIWKAIEAQPDIVCIEYSAHFGPTERVTIPYDPAFKWKKCGHWFRGASIAALESLGAEKGYRLVGCESSGTNAFFVHRSIDNGLPSLGPGLAYMPSAKAVTGEIDTSQLVAV